MDFNPNLKNSKKKAIKIDYNENNKMPKVSNFFRGDIVTNNNNKQPKRFSYDKKEPYYSSHIKENELEPKLLIEKLPPAFNLKNQRNSNDSKNTANTKYSSNEQKNNGYNKLALNNSNEASPEEIIKINFNKQKKKKEQETKINNYFIEKERNIQKQLQIKKDNTQIKGKEKEKRRLSQEKRGRRINNHQKDKSNSIRNIKEKNKLSTKKLNSSISTKNQLGTIEYLFTKKNNNFKVFDLSCLVIKDNTMKECNQNLVNKLKKNGFNIICNRINEIKCSKNRMNCEIEICNIKYDYSDKSIFCYKVNNKRAETQMNKAMIKIIS